MATSQESLVVVVERAGQGMTLARDMWHTVYAVRDLRIRVELSNLPNNVQLEQELEFLVRHTKEIAK